MYPTTCVLLFLCLLSCDTRPPVEDGPPHRDASAVVRTDIEWAGTYIGITPAIATDSIHVNLRLFGNNQYRREMYYLSLPDKVRTASGSFVWLGGDTLQLRGLDTLKEATYYAVGNGEITGLYIDGRPLPPALAEQYTLPRVDGE